MKTRNNVSIYKKKFFHIYEQENVKSDEVDVEIIHKFYR